MNVGVVNKFDQLKREILHKKLMKSENFVKRKT